MKSQPCTNCSPIVSSVVSLFNYTFEKWLYLKVRIDHFCHCIPFALFILSLISLFLKQLQPSGSKSSQSLRGSSIIVYSMLCNAHSSPTPPAHPETVYRRQNVVSPEAQISILIALPPIVRGIRAGSLVCLYFGEKIFALSSHLCSKKDELSVFAMRIAFMFGMATFDAVRG
ncbi:hypothetical protein T11_16675 [Trichinella zimbabwensis]|uniref:Uncharacterized protein n=1 Tax=Trichinella zimbabwensis TaxID=268475 RepID=A0A0V1HMZ2_9BILA|nr:hypothetical protein T11_16675 [Trichinella zimbabwensis]